MLKSHLLLCPVPNWPVISERAESLSCDTHGHFGTVFSSYAPDILDRTRRWLAAESRTLPTNTSNSTMPWMPHSCQFRATPAKQSPHCHLGFAVPVPLSPSGPHQRHQAGPALQGSDTPVDTVFPKHSGLSGLIPHVWEGPPRGTRAGRCSRLPSQGLRGGGGCRERRRASCSATARLLCLSQTLCAKRS